MAGSSHTRAESCGPSALRAFFNDAFPEWEPNQSERLWMNRREMETALRGLKVDYEKHQDQWPTRGICIIRWLGPWDKRNYRGSNLRYTHWVSVVGDYVFDANWGSWLPKSIWEELVIPELLKSRPKATGWAPLTGYQFS